MDGTPILDEDLAYHRAPLEDVSDRVKADPMHFIVSPATWNLCEAEAGYPDRAGIPMALSASGPMNHINAESGDDEGQAAADCSVGGFRYERDSKLVGSLVLGLYNDDGET